MAEVLVKFSEPIRGSDQRLYRAQVCGGIAEDGLWEGWIEFTDGGEAIRSGRETEQPNRADLLYWAEGLSYTYLEGALDRARREGATAQSQPQTEDATPAFDGPALGDRAVPVAAASEVRAILNPFTVYAEGEEILRRQLNALSRDQVKNIGVAYQLGVDPLDTTSSRAALAAAIVARVRSTVVGAGSDTTQESRSDAR
jgi:hypothetical protein